MRKGSLLTIFLVVFIDLMGFGIMLPNLQLYGKRFGISSYLTLTALGASYSLFQFLFSPVLGAWSDRIGRRPVLLISQAGTLFGFLLLYVAHFFEGPAAQTGVALLFASRIIDGISGGNISAASAYIADSTTPENRAKGMGLIGAAFGLGFVFGPAIGGIVGRAAGLHWVPLVSAAFSLAALTMTFFMLPESLDRAHATPPDQLRRYSLTRLWKPLSRPIIGPMIAMAFISGFGFSGMEQTFSLLVYKRVYEPTAGSLPDHDMQAAIDKAGQSAGFATGMLLFFVGVVIAITQGGLIHRLTKKFGEAKLIITGPLFIAVGMFILAADLPRLIPGIWLWSGFVAGCFGLAFGSSIFNPALQSLVSRHAGPREQGEIMGDLQGMASLARVAGPLAAGALFQFVLPGTVYQGAAAYWVSGALALIVSIWAFGLRDRLVPPLEAKKPGGFPVELKGAGDGNPGPS
jgi:DHA1 family tetracycline resistance protein-like MFS transporter